MGRVAELGSLGRMRTPLAWIVGLAIVAALFFGYAHLHGRAMQRATMYSARLFIEKAHSEFESTGVLPPSQPHAQLTLYSNAVVIGGVTQRCAVALDWRIFRGLGFLAISTNRTVFWIDQRRGPRIIDDSYRAPLFGGGV